MNLIELYNTVGAVSLGRPNVNSYHPKSPYIALQEREVPYSAMCFTVEGIRDDEEYRVFECNLYYADRLQQDGSNWIEIQNDAYLTLYSVIDELREAEGISGIETTSQLQFFNQRMVDYVAGAWITIEIIIPIDFCNE